CAVSKICAAAKPSTRHLACRVPTALRGTLNTRESSRSCLLRGPGGISRSIGLRVCADGVDTREQRELVERRGCQEAQGPYFGGAVDPRSRASDETRHAAAGVSREPSPGLRPPSPRWRGARGSRYRASFSPLVGR